MYRVTFRVKSKVSVGLKAFSTILTSCFYMNLYMLGSPVLVPMPGKLLNESTNACKRGIEARISAVL